MEERLSSRTTSTPSTQFRLSMTSSDQRLTSPKSIGSTLRTSASSLNKLSIALQKQSSDSLFGMETYSSDGDSDDEYKKVKDDYGPVSGQLGENSVIPEVAATVPTTDNDSLPIFTWRVAVISTVLIIFSAFCTQFYFVRQNRITLTTIAQILLAYALGNCLDKIPLGKWNSHKFNYKEHTLIVIAVAAANDFDYPIIAMMIQRFYLGQRKADIVDDGVKIGTVSSILFIMLAEMLGIGLGGLFEKFLVYPAEMWWPSNLVYANLIHTFHGTMTKKITRLRMRMFLFVLGIGFVYQVIPQVIAPLLGSVSLICLIGMGLGYEANGASTLLGQFGSRQGGGIGAFSFDWSSFTALGPMVTPLWSQLNYLFSNIFFSWILTPLLYFLDVWEAKDLTNVYGREAMTLNNTIYDITPQLSPDFRYTPTNDASPIRLSINRVLVYGAGFASLSAVLSQFFLYYYQKTTNVLNMPLSELEEKDIHTKMMKKYPAVPWLWYLGLLCITTLGSIALTQYHHSSFDADWWLIPLAILITCVFIIPIGIIQAVSNQSIGLNIISQLIVGYLKPGSIMANTSIKVYGTNTIMRATGYLAQMKLAFYMKIPPRYVLAATLWGLLLGPITTYLTFDQMVPIVWSVAHQSSRRKGDSPWAPVRLKILWTAAQLWGAISPKRFFGMDTPYWTLFFFFIAGALLPIIFYFLMKRFPNAGFHYVNWPIIFQAVSAVSGGYANAIVSTMIVAVGTQYFIRKYKRQWYDRYNYIVSAGLDVVVAFVAMLSYGLDEADLRMPFYPLKPNPQLYGTDYCGIPPR